MDKKKSIERVKEYLKNFEGDKKDFEAILDVLNEYIESKSDKEIETSDKNVVNIEDDVKIVHKIISFYKDLDTLYDNDKCKEIQALENILAERKQDKKRIQELEADLYSANCTISDYVDSIPKQKVKDKIEEYDKKMTEDAGNSLWVVTDRIVMNVLNELLEDK